MSLRCPAQACIFRCTRCSSGRSPASLQNFNLRHSSPLTYISTPPSRLPQNFIKHPSPSTSRVQFSTSSTNLKSKPTTSTSSPKEKGVESSQGPTPPNTTPAGSSSESWGSKICSFEDVQSLISEPDPKRILIDVREPHELSQTGKIPTAINIPITTSPDAFFLPAEEFEERYELPRPDEETEVVFYCKAGVRSRAAAKLARQAGFGGQVGEYPGSWKDWEAQGGGVER